MPCFQPLRLLLCTLYQNANNKFVSSKSRLGQAGFSVTSFNQFGLVSGSKNLTKADKLADETTTIGTSSEKYVLEPLLLLNDEPEKGQEHGVARKKELCQDGGLGLRRKGKSPISKRCHLSRSSRSVDVLFQMLQCCISKRDLSGGRQVHSLLAKHGLTSNVFLLNHLLRLYSLCGSLNEANEIFCKLSKPDIYNWTALILGYARHGQGQHAVKLYHEMLKSGLKPNEPAFVAALQACSSCKSLTQGRILHADILRAGYDSNVIVTNALLDLYVKCGSINEAHQTFAKLPRRDLISWNIIIGGYTQLGTGEQSVQLFGLMQLEGVTPDRVTFVSLIKACVRMMAKDEGKLMHHHIIERGFELDLFLGSALIDMYAKFGSLEDARELFDRLPNKNIVSWTAMIAGYAEHGSSHLALQLFNKLPEEGIAPNGITFVFALKACCSTAAIEQGKLIHTQIVTSGFDADIFVGTAIIDMYSKCGSIKDARQMFDRLQHRDVVTWNAMILGYAQHGLGSQALKLFRQMQKEEVKPDKVTFLGMLKACGDLGALHEGKLIHRQIVTSGLELDLCLGNSLLDMYAKCGSLEESCQVFNSLPSKNVVSWSALIAGYAQHGFGLQALHLFEKMQQQGVKPNDVTLLGVLSACCHANLLNVGFSVFHSMSETFEITPNMQHYVYMVDLLCRAGSLDKAQEFISRMPLTPVVEIWMSVLNACQIHENVELGRHSFESILKMDPTNDAAYVLMSNIYGAAGMWEDKEEIRKKMKAAGVRKIPGQTWI